jgi:2-polyprenyl-3-methyl-5-hydroxy-6-metoxy-1,4-benzoquinol methylase
MDTQLIHRLIEINRKFYSDFAHAFSETRPSAQTRLERIVAYINDGGKALDVGCGNGRLAERLDHEGRHVQYVGVDASAELVAIANERAKKFANVSAEFFQADIAASDWSSSLPNDFDVVVSLAVLHHVPSFDLRVQVLQNIHALLKPDANLIMTNWQFDRVEGQRKRIVSWDVAGIDEKDLEQGDTLLAWKRGGVGYRYVHLITKSEMHKLAESSGFLVERQFYADAELNLYSILKRKP